MTSEYSGGALADPFVNYRDRVRYLELVKEISNKYSILFLDSIYDKRLYGLVDGSYYIVSPNPELVSFGPYAGTVMGLNYVVKQFNEFRDYFLRVAEETDVEIPDIVSGLTPKRSYVNMEENYQVNQLLVSEQLVELILRDYQENEEKMTFLEFLEKTEEAIFAESMKTYKVTKTGYVMSPYSQAYESGLYIDLASDFSTALDAPKAQLLQDEKFQCYAQIATKYGFYIDMNAPWRLVLNLNSKATRENIKNGNEDRPYYGFFRSEYWTREGLSDFWRIRTFYEKCYYRYVQLLGEEVSYEETTNIETVRWLELYLINRFRESGMLKREDFLSRDPLTNANRATFESALEDCKDRLLRFQLENPLSHRSGPLHYIESLCAENLKNKLRNPKSPPYYPVDDEDPESLDRLEYEALYGSSAISSQQ